MTLEDEPGVFLSHYKFGDIHRSGEHDDRHQRQTERKFIAYHLGAASHGADQRILVVGSPACKQDTEHTHRRNGEHKEDADVPVDDLQAVAPGEAGQHRHRRGDHQIRSELEEETVGSLKADKLLDEDLEHVGKHLQQTPAAHAHRAEAALEPGAELALVKNIEECEHCIDTENQNSDDYAFDQNGEPFRQSPREEQIVETRSPFSEIKHDYLALWL